MRHVKAVAIGILLMAAALTLGLLVTILVPVLVTFACIGLGYFIVAICKDDDNKPP